MKPIDYIVISCTGVLIILGLTLVLLFPTTYTFELPDGKNIITEKPITLSVDGKDYDWNQRNIPIQLTIGCMLVALGGGAGIGYLLGLARES